MRVLNITKHVSNKYELLCLFWFANLVVMGNLLMVGGGVGHWETKVNLHVMFFNFCFELKIAKMTWLSG